VEALVAELPAAPTFAELGDFTVNGVAKVDVVCQQRPDVLLQVGLGGAFPSEVEAADEVEVVLATAVVRGDDRSEQDAALDVHMPAFAAEVLSHVGVPVVGGLVVLGADVELVDGAPEQLLEGGVAVVRHQAHAISRAWR
jgi:hypothetical protein